MSYAGSESERSGLKDSTPRLIEVAARFVEQHFPRRWQCMMCGRATYEFICPDPSCRFLTRDNPNAVFGGEVRR